jgi:hypothetical protein
MEQNEIEILLIEDNPDEAELTIRSLRKHNLANKLANPESESAFTSLKGQ